MNEPMSDSYKKEVEEFKEWASNSLGRYKDFISGVSGCVGGEYLHSYVGLLRSLQDPPVRSARA